VRSLRERVSTAELTAPAAREQPATTPTSASRSATQEEMKQLGLAAAQGDLAALDKLSELATSAIKARTNLQQWVLGDVKLAFDVLGAEAGNGNEVAFDQLWRATRMDHIQGLAITALGQAAGLGNEKALEPLLDPERYLFHRTSTVGALKPAADAGNPRAIEALAAFANQPNTRASWYMVARGLEKAALTGNGTAIDALAVIGADQNPNSRRAALLALERAAINQQQRAVQALRGLGYE
jgi:hypothetical protein